MKDIIKYFFKKHLIYVIFAIFIILNILCFPDLLNDNDIKINDLNWTVHQNSEIISLNHNPIQTNTHPSVHLH
jgi:hypothetical protein